MPNKFWERTLFLRDCIKFDAVNWIGAAYINIKRLTAIYLN